MIFGTVAAVAALFGSEARLKIMQLLSQSPRSVEEIAKLTGESIANTSQHLQRLLAEGLVSVRKDKISRIYNLGSGSVSEFIECLFDLAEELSPGLREACSQLDKPGCTCPVGIKDAIELVRSGKARIIDLRPETESAYSPISGAINIPIEKLKTGASALPKNKKYYLVCRGRYCSGAGEGVKLLRALGYEAYKLRSSHSRINGEFPKRRNAK